MTFHHDVSNSQVPGFNFLELFVNALSVQIQNGANLLSSRIQNGVVRCSFCSAAKTKNKANFNQDCLLIYEINYANTSQSAI